MIISFCRNGRQLNGGGAYSCYSVFNDTEDDSFGEPSSASDIGTPLGSTE